ncbi:hypothetical protein DXU92_03960 [Brachybacterium saurashtrense]|uniref:Cell wall-binding repeat-containing protein n=1 Tax=Brachybacterium saurashtrense TaxID=556288 RepID=A0A345YTM1_9MICO|nr:hypothetical protein DWV08_12210 [Brachybacterium saurashtrense]RRR24394.1 hypothetical protein DXU92_03960 [Brachybacterium saurashtrense]
MARRTFSGAAALTLIGALGACTGEGRADVVLVGRTPTSTVLPDDDIVATALALSTTLFDAADVALVAAEEDAVGALAPLGAETGLPLLVGAGTEVAEELSRLGARTVVTIEGADLSALGGEIEVLAIDPASRDLDLPQVGYEHHPLPILLCLDPSADSPGRELAAAVVTGAGGEVTDMPGGDAGRSHTTIAAIRKTAGEDPSVGVLALGESFGQPEDWAPALKRVLAAPELPGGGTTAFPGRRMIAAYGSPGTPSLGVLGEQDLPATITRVQELAAEYEGLGEEPVVPALEVIATVADSDPGPDGDYSRDLPASALREWVDAAGDAGAYVVLDLQPGTTDFLTQARLFEDLLTAPHVGLALDAEWRLAPGKKHLAQIGSVTAAEINEVSTWLADLTEEHSLPQKVLILHQFAGSMIRDRQDVDTSRPELAITLHADGHGTPEDKLGTYQALQQGLPDGIAMAWKNFYDEDSPMLTPEETFAIEPRPWFVSYQ